MALGVAVFAGVAVMVGGTAVAVANSVAAGGGTAVTAGDVFWQATNSHKTRVNHTNLCFFTERS
jgi:hypothetical protein